jgi:hypothetical protein
MFGDRNSGKDFIIEPVGINNQYIVLEFDEDPYYEEFERAWKEKFKGSLTECEAFVTLKKLNSNGTN